MTLRDVLEIVGVPIYTFGAHVSPQKRKKIQAPYLDLISFHLFWERYDQINLSKKFQNYVVYISITENRRMDILGLFDITILYLLN